MSEHGEDVWLTAAECAGRMGLTVRALRLYERLGLLAPRRTQKNWRLYGPADIARLGEIVALKRLGLSLSRIAALLSGRDADLGGLLAMQHQMLLDLRERTERGLRHVETMRAKIAAGALLSTDELLQLAKETDMTDAAQDAAAWRRYEQMRPRVEARINPALLSDYAGHYELPDGSGLVVAHRGERLFVQVTGQPEVEAFTEAEDKLFLRVVPAQLTFTRDAKGAVTGLVLHQNGFEQAAPRVDEAVTQRAEETLAERVRNRSPFPDSENLLRRAIADYQRGEPDYGHMTSPLADVARAQTEAIRDELARLGALRAIAFRGVNPQGWDVYEVTFENGKQEWAFTLAADGRFSGLYARPTL
ncbi:MAG: MerR family transcriptional regulator [Pseudochelatococcus sp.]|jgi:DNA-binding transcriptional MerR regulator|uniref:MerR family transcriptional regulator n=1 Tax=Pseudochelatococcus sp. TaxID=2020869 RepID=UPI003D8BA389